MTKLVALAIFSTIAVAVGILNMPFGYYTLLRAVLCLSSAVGFAASRQRQDASWPWVYGVLAVLYNPIFPVHLGAKGLWIVLNVASLACLWLGAFRFRGAMRATSLERR